MSILESDAVHSVDGAARSTLGTAVRMSVALLLAAALALSSVFVQRTGPEQVQQGNLCGPRLSDPCYEPQLKGGFPFPYLFDSPGVSVAGKLSFFEDSFNPWAFIVDAALYFAAVLLVARSSVRLRRSPRHAADA